MNKISSVDYYQQRINKALAYIDAHLKEDLNVKQLATEANFSLYHFQRIFKTIQGESPYDALLRIRLERSVFLLKHRDALSVSEIAYESGFKSVENFSRQFKSRFKHSPSVYRKDKKLQNSRIYQEETKHDFYTHTDKKDDEQSNNYEVVIEQLEAIPIAFIRAIFGEDGSVLVQRYQQLISWAESIGIPYTGALHRFGMSIDHPDVTPAQKYRYDFAIRRTKKIKVEGLIEVGEIPKGPYATIHCQGVLSDVAKAWDQLYKRWLPQSKYVPRDYPAIEEFIQGPEEIGWESFNIKCRIPVQKRNQ